jgi:RNA polymerase sigma-70 factor (ECF subfamily)
MNRHDPMTTGVATVSDEHLLDRMARGDESALEALYDRYNRLVHSLALRVVGSTMAAEDVTIEVFWQAWTQARQYDPSRGKAYTWIMMITRTRAIDQRRRLQRQEPSTDDLEDYQPTSAEYGVEPDEELFLIEQRRRVLAALDSLPEAQRQVIELAYYEGMSHSEIAARLNEPLGTVKGRIRMAMAHLREQLLPLAAANDPRLSRPAYISEPGY